jgi:hypothetical protein
MLTFDGLIAPGLDRPLDLLVQVRHCRGRYLRTQERLGDVFTRRTETPARYISIKASSTELSRRR